MKRQIKIIKNVIQCKICGEILESENVHDFKMCKCMREDQSKGCAVDGGHSYLKRCGNPENIIDLSETRPYTDEEQEEYEKRICNIY